MLLYENSGDINISEIDGDQVAIKKLNPHQSKKVIGIWKNPLVYMNKQTRELKNKIKE